MKRVRVKFLYGVTEVVAETVALFLAAAHAKFQEDKIDRPIKLKDGSTIYISSLLDMEDHDEPETLTVEQELLAIMAHNKRCAMADYIWYYVEGGKVIRTTRDVMEKRVKEKNRAQLAAKKGVSSVGPDGQVRLFVPIMTPVK